jgi:hypothetical protein
MSCRILTSYVGVGNIFISITNDRKQYNAKIKVVTFVIESGRKVTFEVNVKKWGWGSCFCRFFYHKFFEGYIEINTWSFPYQLRYQFFGGYIEINTWSFPYQPRYYPETPISAQNGVEGLYESGEDSRDDMEKVMY